LLFWTWLSEKLKGNVRIWICIFAQLWAFPFLIALELLPTQPLPWVRFALLTALLVYPYIQAIQVALMSRNSNTVRTRTVSSAFYNMCNQLGSLIGSNIYRADDAPYYKRGNRVLIGLAAMNILLYLLAKGYYVYKNRQREKIWSRMSSAAQADYLRTTRDEGNKRLDFRFAH
jgi:predicted MFS family arabinose efflux permease